MTTVTLDAPPTPTSDRGQRGIVFECSCGRDIVGNPARASHLKANPAHGPRPIAAFDVPDAARIEPDNITVASGAMPREQLDRERVALRLGVSTETISTYRQRARSSPDKHPFPEPDGVLGRSPWWWSTTIDKWSRKRPGQGAGAGRPFGAIVVGPDEVNAVTCPTCAAPPGVECHTIGGTDPVRRPHSARRLAAIEAREETP